MIMYKEGVYFSDITRHQEDCEYKVRAISRILIPVLNSKKISVNSYADVGCGSGGVTLAMKNQMENLGYKIGKVEGYDISPHLSQLKMDGIEFKIGDFAEIGEKTDLITLTDVFEHVTNPVEFISKVSKKAKVVAFHIPLDDCFTVNLRNLQRQKIKNPGHLIFLNTNSALNLITFSGLQIVDYDYSMETLSAPSNNETLFQKIAFPIKFLISKISPWLMARIFGFSLVVVAVNENFEKSEI